MLGAPAFGPHTTTVNNCATLSRRLIAASVRSASPFDDPPDDPSDDDVAGVVSAEAAEPAVEAVEAAEEAGADAPGEVCAPTAPVPDEHPATRRAASMTTPCLSAGTPFTVTAPRACSPTGSRTGCDPAVNRLPDPAAPGWWPTIRPAGHRLAS
ncbi:hypothetical protein GCM10023074_17600 [Microbispora amethystogenes]|uniref:Uncharacterized protein n=1 Tax=Microbispora amethystogenes TaxID=1427754 RepID=A0ABQ4F6T2_9ACTN|nr:hypothetical protein Mam01_06810 [Microbispora amethystogenes]